AAGDAPRCGPDAHVIYQGGEVATQTAVNRPTAGSNPAPGATHARRLPAKWIGRSPPKAAQGVRISPGRHLARYASGKRGGCLPPIRRVRFSSGSLTRQGIPISRGRRLRPGVLQVQVLSLVPTGA